MGNKYDELYDFRMANLDDVDDIMTFIREEWGQNHILAHDRELFLWQYGRTEYGDRTNVNVVLMTRKSGEIIGMIGFVPYSDNPEELHISTAITKVISRDILPLSGLELMRRQTQIVGEKANFASGTNPKTIMPIFERIFKHKVGIMQQYYMLNRKVKEFCIAIPERNRYIPDYEISDHKLIEINVFSELDNLYDLREKNYRMSIKSSEYVKKRFFEHPVYKYRKWCIRDERGHNIGVLFGRDIQIGTAHILRIVDYRGDLKHLEKLGKALHSLMENEEYEYIDLMASDLSDLELGKAGFELLDPDGSTIIPHYFEPFERRNIKNHYQTNADIVIFKADGDQDRPNIRR